MKESKIQTDIRLELGKLANQGVVFWRNTVGQYTEFDAKTNGERIIHYGLGKGSADLIGCVHGRFIGLEVKQPGKNPEQHQVLWTALVRAKGGLVATVRSVDDALAAVRRILSARRCPTCGQHVRDDL